jgi:hypothetical protein
MVCERFCQGFGRVYCISLIFVSGGLEIPISHQRDVIFAFLLMRLHLAISKAAMLPHGLPSSRQIKQTGEEWHHGLSGVGLARHTFTWFNSA